MAPHLESPRGVLAPSGFFGGAEGGKGRAAGKTDGDGKGEQSVHGHVQDDGGTLHCSGVRAMGRGKFFSAGALATVSECVRQGASTGGRDRGNG